MKLETLTVELRPRSGWEAMELGSALVRRHARAIWVPWVIVTLPAYALLNALFWWADTLWLAWTVFVLLLPVWDRIPLFVISSAVFGGTPSTRQTLLKQATWGWRRLPAFLLWRRILPWRSLTMPVDFLEGGDRAMLAERRRVIGGGAVLHALMQTTICGFFVVLLQISLLLSTVLFVPEQKLGEYAEGVMTLFGRGASFEIPAWVVLVWNAAGYLAISFVEPFYIGGGFGLYLNRRTQLEAWDVEIAFRRMRKRLEAGALGVMLLLTACWPLAVAAQAPSPTAAQTQPADRDAPPSSPTPPVPIPSVPPTLSPTPEQDAPPGLQAQPDEDENAPTASDQDTTPKNIDAAAKQAAEEAAKQAAKQVATGEEDTDEEDDGPPPRELSSIFGENTAEHSGFGKAVERAYEDKDLRPKRRVEVWQRRDPLKPRPPSEQAMPTLGWLSDIIGFIGEYGLWLLFGVLLLMLALTAKYWLPWLRGIAMPGEPEPIAIEVKAAEHTEPLPPNIAESARRLWREGQPRRALALLYRASVEAMVTRAGTHLPPGATEAECLRVSRRMPEAEDRTVFQQMVRIWQYAAYGQRMPDETDFETILQSLIQRFGWRT